MSQSTPSSEILRRLEDAGVPKAAIAKRLAVANSAVSDLYAGRRQLKHDEAVKLLEMLPPESQMRELPVIGMAGAGNWIEAVDVTRSYVPIPSNFVGKFATEVVGDSMNKLLPEGALAIVNPDDTSLHVGKVYLLINEDGEATIKRFRADPARFEPVSDNWTHQPFEIGSIPFRVLGRVTGSMQQL